MCLYMLNGLYNASKCFMYRGRVILCLAITYLYSIDSKLRWHRSRDYRGSVLIKQARRIYKVVG